MVLSAAGGIRSRDVRWAALWAGDQLLPELHRARGSRVDQGAVAQLDMRILSDRTLPSGVIPEIHGLFVHGGCPSLGAHRSQSPALFSSRRGVSASRRAEHVETQLPAARAQPDQESTARRA